MDVKWYVQKLDEVCKELDNAGMRFVSTTAKLQVACAILQELARDERMRARTSSPAESAKSEPATEAQLKYLRSLGVEPKPGLTKQEASKLIDELKAGGKPG